MKVIQKEDFLRIMREEWDAKKAALAEQVDLTLNSKVDGDAEPVLAPELKVRHKKSRIRYTICSVGPRDVILRTPEGEQFIVGQGELEQEYELD